MPDTETKPAEPRELETIDLDRQLCQIRFSPDGAYLLGGGYDATIRRLDFLKEVHRLREQRLNEELGALPSEVKVSLEEAATRKIPRC